MGMNQSDMCTLNVGITNFLGRDLMSPNGYLLRNFLYTGHFILF